LTGATGPAGGVSKIIAGTNITISPTSGLGDVTVNSSGGGATSSTYSLKLIFNYNAGAVATSNGFIYSVELRGSDGTSLFSRSGTSIIADVGNPTNGVNGWGLTIGAIASGSGNTGVRPITITYDVATFPGTFTNFRRVAQNNTGSSGYYCQSVFTTINSGLYIVVTSGSIQCIGLGVLALGLPTTGPVVANQIAYIVFDYLSPTFIY
jgi:hypothetical protein